MFVIGSINLLPLEICMIAELAPVSRGDGADKKRFDGNAQGTLFGLWSGGETEFEYEEVRDRATAGF